MSSQVGFLEGLITITKQGIVDATFVVNDVFESKVTSVSVQYRSDSGTFDCLNFGEVQNGWTIPVAAVCVDGVTQVNVVVDFGQQRTSEACEQCMPPDVASRSTVFYSYEIDCYPVCETEAPSESPSLSKAPTSAPSPGPSSGPTPCIEKAKVDLLEKLGTQDIPQDPLDLITITSQNTSSVGFIVNPAFADSVSVISVHYFESEGNIDCDVNKNVLRNTVLSYSAFCVDGVADVSIYIQPIGPPVEECLSCLAPGDSGSAVNAYYYSLPCLPVCEPDVKLETVAFAAPSSSPQTVLDIDCYTGAVDVTPVGASKCPYGGENPIVIASMDQASVTFQVKNTFGSFAVCESSDFTVRFQQEGMSKPTCNPPHVAKFSEFTHVTYRAMCVNGFAEVEVFASCRSGGQLAINPTKRTFENTCGGTSECSHLFVVPCNPNDMCGTSTVSGSRRLDSPESIASAGAMLREASTEEDDLPYCLSDDFPCEGEEANMVYVCHYSARKGYQTFCVPETDSDILRFYANDYCGPCEGGRGATWGRFAVNG